jgi:hypothetical protein
MRWLSNRCKRERGATAVLVALIMVPLLGAAALVLDIGAAYAEKAQLQNGADASALAIAKACVKSESSCTSAAGLAEGMSYAGLNANDGAANWIENPDIDLAANSVEVRPSTLAADGSTSVSHPFAATVGLDEAWTIDARAKAIWGGIRSGPTLPLAIAECEIARHVIPTSGEESAPFLLLSAGSSLEDCPGGFPGGFGWLTDPGGEDCEAHISADATVPGTTGNNIQHTGCESMTEAELAAVVERIGCDVGTSGSTTLRFFDCLLGATILVPLYGSSVDESTGPNNRKIYTITQFAAFHVTGYQINLASGGGVTTKYLAGAPASPTFAGNDRGLRGTFVRYVSLDEAYEIGGDPGSGLGVVRLVPSP